MLPPKPSRPTKKHTGVYVEEDVLFRADALAKSEHVKSRNMLLGSFLAFAVDLYPLIRSMRAQIEAFAAKEECSYVEAIAQLIERGLKSKR